MANMIEIDWRPDRRTLRHFGFIAVGGFGFIAAIAWFEVLIFSFGLGEARPFVSGGFAALAAGSGLLSIVYPAGNLPIYMLISALTYPIGFVLSYVIMGTLFYLIIAPIGLLLLIAVAIPQFGSAQYALSQGQTLQGLDRVYVAFADPNEEMNARP